MKLCTGCNIEKELEEFHKDSSKKDGHAFKCKECKKKLHADHYKKTADRKIEYVKQYKINNGTYGVYDKAAYIRYRDSGKKRRIDLQRRVRKTEADLDYKITSNRIDQMLKEQNFTCKYCEKPLVEYHVDHVVPLCKGGDNSKENLVIACPKCNLSKGGKLLSEWHKQSLVLNCNFNTLNLEE